MPEFYPLHDLGVFVKDFSLFEVEGFVRFWAWSLDEWLVNVGRMEDIILKPEEPLKGSANKLRMTETICNKFEFLLGFNFYIIFVAFMVEIFSDWSVPSFIFPLLNMSKVKFSMEWSVTDKPVLIGKGKGIFLIDISSRESQIL